MNIAEVIKDRSTCLSRQVGCVLVKNKQILSTGYNGSIRGHAHCDEFSCKRGCNNTIHAEVNAVISAAYRGINISYCTIYTTTSPCTNCLKILLSLNIKKIYYKELYYNNEIEVKELLKNHPQNIGLIQL
tara:strand:- start:412 stop:801 length:390 start_codon:yes stop_codon:yes gene_type:complete